jgi:O-methyltransferase
MVVNLSRIEHKALTAAEAVRATYGLAKMLIEEGVPGDFVECGVYAGAHPAAMAKAILDTGAVARRVHLFDSFEGIPMAGVRDTDWCSGDPVHRQLGSPSTSSGISSCSLETVQRNMALWEVQIGRAHV